MYLEILEDMKEMREMKIRKENEEKIGNAQSSIHVPFFGEKLNVNHGNNAYNLNEEIKEVENDDKILTTPFVLKKEEDAGEGLMKTAIEDNLDEKKEAGEGDIEEKKKNRLENNFNFLKSLNLLKQETPKNKEDRPKVNFILPEESTVVNNLTPNVSSKHHTNSNIVRPVDKKKNRLMNNLNMIVSKLINAENFSNTFADNPNTQAVNLGSIVETHPLNLNIIRSEEHDKDKIDKILSGNNNQNNNQFSFASLFNREKTQSKRPKGLNWLKESIVSNTSKFYGVNPNKEDISYEIKQLKKELSLYKTTVENLSGELEVVKQKNMEIDNIVSEFQETQNKIFQSEVENFNHILNIYKNLYEEEIKSNRGVIEELGKVVDEVYLK